MAKTDKEVEQITKQPVLNIGMAGHIDHGKTTLLYQLTGKWSDTHSEELKRGITIKLGYADSIIKRCEKCGQFTVKDKCECGGNALPVRYVSFVDVPGHEMLMATMLSGAAIIDAAILVISANEPCPRPQTKEHLVALDLKGISNIIVVQNKVDLVTEEEALKNYNQIKEFIKGTVAEASPIIPLSAQQGVNIDALLEQIMKLPIPQRNTEAEPIFIAARSFDVNKPGADASTISGGILGGILKQGTLSVGDEIEIKPGMTSKKHNETVFTPLITKISGIQSGKNRLQSAISSGSLAIQTELDPMLTKADSLAGCVVGLKGKVPDAVSAMKIKATLFKEIIGEEKKTEEELRVAPLKMNEPLMISVNTTITVGFVAKLKGDTIDLTLKTPVVILPGTKIGLARNIQGHWRLIGYGEALK
jgi:translation initiation factor 2 subunit 3